MLWLGAQSPRLCMAAFKTWSAVNMLMLTYAQPCRCAGVPVGEGGGSVPDGCHSISHLPALCCTVRLGQLHQHPHGEAGLTRPKSSNSSVAPRSAVASGHAEKNASHAACIGQRWPHARAQVMFRHVPCIRLLVMHMDEPCA